MWPSSGTQDGVGVNTAKTALTALYTDQAHTKPALGCDALCELSSPSELCGERQAKSRAELSKASTREAALAL